jgi:hypothetical protein
MKEKIASELPEKTHSFPYSSRRIKKQPFYPKHPILFDRSSSSSSQLAAVVPHSQIELQLTNYRLNPAEKKNNSSSSSSSNSTRS